MIQGLTQGILKYSNVYGLTFGNKYLDIKTIKTIDNYNSKFLATNIGKTSQTSTVLVNNNVYYNVVEKCVLTNCDVEIGKFIKTDFFGESGVSYINDGFFSGCTFSNYIINGGNFYNCVIQNNCVWNEGQWSNANLGADFGTTWNGGVWNSGVFSGSWSGGTFNGGLFQYPGVWYNGIANGGVFSGITWYNGLARNAAFIEDCTFLDGIFNTGLFNDSKFKGGNFNGGKMNNSIISGGTIYNGIISGCTVHGDAEIRGGRFTDMIINNGRIFNMEGSNILVNNGKFYSGNYNNIRFLDGDIYNGSYFNISGCTSGLTIHNGIFKNSEFHNTYVENGNFTKCISRNLTWLYGIYTEGEMYDSVWYNGYWNDGIFSAISACDLSGILECDGNIFAGISTNISDCGLTGILESNGDIFVGTSLSVTTVKSWYNGQFYGGIFNGNFGGGVFHYGYLNGIQYLEQSKKPKPFIQ